MPVNAKRRADPRALESVWPQTALLGGFLAVAGDSTSATH